MKALTVIIATIAMMFFASEAITFEGFLIQLGAGAVLAIIILITKRNVGNV